MQRKRRLLEEPHIAPLTAFVHRLRAQRGEAVPWFDPTEAGTEARILLLFENPGRRADAARGSGFISADNDDASAENTWGFFREAGIDRRRDIVAWNIVPWYLGDDRRIGRVRATDIEDARPALLEQLELLPNLRVVVLFGRKAQDGWRRARPPVDVEVLEAPHTSGQWLNGHPEDRAVIVGQLRKARELSAGHPRARTFPTERQARWISRRPGFAAGGGEPMTATTKNVFLMSCGSPQFRFPDEWMTAQPPAGRVVTDTHINKWWSSGCQHQLRIGDIAVLVATGSGKVMGAFEVVSEPIEDHSAPVDPDKWPWTVLLRPLVLLDGRLAPRLRDFGLTAPHKYKRVNELVAGDLLKAIHPSL